MGCIFVISITLGHSICVKLYSQILFGHFMEIFTYYNQKSVVKVQSTYTD